MKYLVYVKIHNTKIQSVIPAMSTEQAKETFLKHAQEWYTPGTFYHRDILALKPEHITVEEFQQEMSDIDAERLHDPAYQQALLQGGNAIVMYYYQDVLEKYAKRLYLHADTIMKTNDLPDEIRSCNPREFLRIFDISELNNGDYAEFWPLLSEAANNGLIGQLKRSLIDTFHQL